MNVALSRPDIGETEIRLVNDVLRGSHLALGPRALEFEDAVAGYVGRRYGVAVNSGTSGLHLLVRAFGIGEGDEVVTTPFSFIASSNAILYERATPVFVDVEEATGNIDPERIEAAITARTRAILYVDVFGRPARFAEIRELGRRHGLVVIEDACEALGAERGGVRAGHADAGDAAVFAFYPNKQITTGEGGLIVTDSPEIAALCRSMRNQGRRAALPERGGAAGTAAGADGTAPAGGVGGTQRGAGGTAGGADAAAGADGGSGAGRGDDMPDAWADLWLSHERLGYNYRMDELSAALGVAQMRRIEELLAARERVAALYRERLGGVEGVRLPHVEEDVTRTSWFAYVIRVGAGLRDADAQARLRAAVMRRLLDAGVQCRPYFTPIHLQPFYRERFGFAGGEFPVAEKLGRTSIAIPFHTRLTPEEIDYVAGVIERAVADDRPAGVPA